MNKKIKQITDIIENHKKLVTEFEELSLETVISAAQSIIKALKRNHTVYLCGNGGSAADAQHIAAELMGRFARERKALPAVAFSTNTSIITSVANDYDYEYIFARQAEALVKKGDVLWALSTSGTSPNVIKAAHLAKQKGAFILAFTGRTGSKLEHLADLCLCVEDVSTARSQEIHQLAYHIICELVEQSFADS